MPSPSGSIRLNEVSLLTSHMSSSGPWERKKPRENEPAFPFQPEHFYAAGCRGIELDLVEDRASGEWCVRHPEGLWHRLFGVPFDPTFTRLSSYLKALRDWSLSFKPAQPHDVFFVHLDLKRVHTHGPLLRARLDGYLRAHLEGITVLTPSHFLPGGQIRRRLTHDSGKTAPRPDAPLNSFMKTKPWPKLDELRGMLVFVLSGKNEGLKRAYAAEWDHAIAFCDSEYGKHRPMGEGAIIENSDLNDLPGPRALADWRKENPSGLWRIYNVPESEIDRVLMEYAPTI
ncbi:MAG: hypothetical protein FJZ95_10675, partial [Chloroflexi bacterium]|nr:hypothetical protein [Chloroflexota bacterium]